MSLWGQTWQAGKAYYNDGGVLLLYKLYYKLHCFNMFLFVLMGNHHLQTWESSDPKRLAISANHLSFSSFAGPTSSNVNSQMIQPHRCSGRV